jgi:hypothetical protein
MARQQDTCWRCGSQWASEDAPRTTLKVIPGGAQVEHDVDRWANEGVVATAVAARAL